MKIGIFTASTPIGSLSPQRAKRAIAFLESKGHEVILGDLFYKQDFYRSGTIQERANEINKLVDQELDVLMSAIGGFVTNSILPFLDYEKINKNVKVVSGYSDTTALLNAINAKCPNVKTIYGAALMPNFGEMETESAELTWKKFERLLTNGSHEMREIINNENLFIYDEDINWETFQKERTKSNISMKVINPDKIPNVTGRLIGGNINTLPGIMGSPYFQKPKPEEKIILLLEGVDIPISILEQQLSLLALNGLLDNLEGIILGTWLPFDDEGTGRRPIDVLLEILGDHRVPIIYEVPVAHDRPMYPSALNQQTSIDFDNMTISQLG